MAALCLLVLTACTSSLPGMRVDNPASQTGTVQIAASIAPQSLSANPPVATLVQGHLSRTLSLQPAGDVYVGEVSALPAGDWRLTVELYDDAGDLTHSGGATVRVKDGANVLVQVEVLPVNAVLEVAVDLADFPERDAVGKVRLTFASGSTWTLSPVPGVPHAFHGEKAMPAGDYEFSVGLYGQTFYASDRIYESPWESVRLASGKRAQVQWRAGLGGTALSAEIVGLPPAPQGISCDVRSEEVWITWESAGYAPGDQIKIYVRDDEFLPAKHVGTAAATDGAWLLGPRHQYAAGSLMLTRVDARGKESYRSEPLALEACAAI